MTSVDTKTARHYESFQTKLAREIATYAPKYINLSESDKAALKEFWETNKGQLKLITHQFFRDPNGNHTDQQLRDNYFFLNDLIKKIKEECNGYCDLQYILIMILRDTIMRVSPSYLSKTGPTH